MLYFFRQDYPATENLSKTYKPKIIRLACAPCRFQQQQ